MKQISLIILLAIVLTACGGARDTSTPSNPAAATAPNTSAPAPVVPTASNNAATNAPAPAAPATNNAPAATPSGNATVPAATPVGSSTAAITSTAKPRPRPTATSTGPLTFTGTGIYVANCRLAPTTDKPGKVIIQISVEVTGGNGVYQYFDNDGVKWPTKFIDVPGERGTPLIGKVKVTSGGGQSIEKEYDIGFSDLTCS
jgi:hypothetical protein